LHFHAGSSVVSQSVYGGCHLPLSAPGQVL
jgi:hypothetical protein